MTRHKKTRTEKNVDKIKKQLEGPVAAKPQLAKTPVKPPPPKKSDNPAPKPPGRIKKLLTFFRDAKRELVWVTFPTRQETIKSTGVLLVLVGISAIYLGLVDGILTRLLSLVVD
ncbi:MAG: preprotein translocase subunit SecE [Deltaproteobacteria bacterium]|jgi:preprotein translocase subunit SecE|nr:preprotein translocase subunit SecE [Deltaproteobacteria bacterium]